MSWNSNRPGQWGSRHGRPRYGGTSFNRPPGNRRPAVQLEIDTNAIGLFFGQRGRNIKELQARPDIRYLDVDSKKGIVSVVGSDEAVEHVKRRILMVSTVALNSKGHFPEKTLTFLEGVFPSSQVRFQPVTPSGSYPVAINKLDVNRDYFLIEEETRDPGRQLDEMFAGIRLSQSMRSMDDLDATRDSQRILVGNNREMFESGLLRMITDSDNLNHLIDASARASVSINFGKTFLSSVPEDLINRAVSIDEIQDVPYGMNGLRPEFTHLLLVERERLLESSLFDDYELVESGSYIVIHCVSQRDKKRYQIKLKRSEDDQNIGDGDREEVEAQTNEIQAIALAETYYQVLGIADNATTTQVKIAYMQKAKLVHPDKCRDVFASKAMVVLNEARDCLMNRSEREAYDHSSRSEKLPRNKFHYKPTVKSAPLPAVIGFCTNQRKLGLVTVLRSSAAKIEFRMNIETERDEAQMNWSMRDRLERAWKSRTKDDKLEFSRPGGQKDWLVIATVQYMKKWKYTNGSFILTLREETLDKFGNRTEGLSMSLDSCSVDELLSNAKRLDHDDAANSLVTETVKLEEEARRIAQILDALS